MGIKDFLTVQQLLDLFRGTRRVVMVTSGAAHDMAAGHVWPGVSSPASAQLPPPPAEDAGDGGASERNSKRASRLLASG